MAGCGFGGRAVGVDVAVSDAGRMSGLCQFASSSVFSDVGSVELLAFCFVGELVVKNQILKRERTWSGGRQGFGMGQAIRSLLCGVVSVGSLVGTNSWAQLPESAVIDPAALEEAVLDNTELEKELLKEGLLEEERLKKELLEEKGGGCLLYTSPSPRD